MRNKEDGDVKKECRDKVKMRENTGEKSEEEE